MATKMNTEIKIKRHGVFSLVFNLTTIDLLTTSYKRTHISLFKWQAYQNGYFNAYREIKGKEKEILRWVLK